MYFINILVALDRLGNALMGLDSRNCLSTEAYLRSWKLAKWLDVIDKNHCYKSYLYDNRHTDLESVFKKLETQNG